MCAGGDQEGFWEL